MKGFTELYFLIISIAILSILFILFGVFYEKFTFINVQVRKKIHSTRKKEIRGLMIFTHNLNDVLISSLQVIVVSIILGFLWKDWKSGVFIMASQSIQLGVVTATKKLSRKARPPHLTAHKVMTSGSYPSGHSAATLLMAFLTASFLSIHLSPWVVLIVFIVFLFNALATAYGRLYLDMHWAVDILGGWILAVITTLITYYLRYNF